MTDQTVNRILKYCMALEGTDDMEQAYKIAKLCQFIHDGKPTRTGKIVDTLLQADEDVTYLKVKQVIERLEISEKDKGV